MLQGTRFQSPLFDGSVVLAYEKFRLDEGKYSGQLFTNQCHITSNFRTPIFLERCSFVTVENAHES